MVLINCTTKGCLQQSEAKLDRESQEVICEVCGNEIKNISEMMKKSLNSVGQVVRNKVTKPFQQYCNNCHAIRSLYVKKNAAHCEVCNAQITVTPSFFQGLKLHLERSEKYKNDGIE